jgi:hypothetical protein
MSWDTGSWHNAELSSANPWAILLALRVSPAINDKYDPQVAANLPNS